MPKFTKEDDVLGTLTRESDDPREIADLKYRQGFTEVKNDQGGQLPSGSQTVRNTTGRNEPVITPAPSKPETDK